MIRLVIADDDTIIRTSIKTMVDWEREGVSIVGEAANGRQALAILESTPADVLLTDIKMPQMDGLALLERLQAAPGAPAAVVLSAYDEFALVRRAFTLGAVDYLLKSEMTAQGVLGCVRKAAERSRAAAPKPGAAPAPSPALRLREAALSGQGLSEAIQTPCVLACFELDGYAQVRERFGADPERALVRPLLDFAAQIPRVQSGAVACSLTPSTYLLALFGRSEEAAQALCGQVARTWKLYMNLSASVGISGVAEGPEMLEGQLAACMQNVSMRHVLGPGQLLTAGRYRAFDLPWALSQAERTAPLLEALGGGHDSLMNERRGALFAPYYEGPVARARQLTLAVVYHTARMLSGMGMTLPEAFDGAEYDYAQRAQGLAGAKECEIWTANFLRHIALYLMRRLRTEGVDPIERAKRYLRVNYQRPELSVRAVADAVGLSEKYFSTRFNREVGQSVSAYVNDLRIARARELLRQTDLKVYEVAEAVGYKGPEHFIRVFRRREGMPPSAYKQQHRTKSQ